jgi:5-formyltetrahydrofolate cyclo-ligase
MTSAADVAAAKAALRRLTRSRNAAVPPAQRSAAYADITARVLSLPVVRAARVVGAYAAGPGEVATDSLISALRERGATVVLPVLQPDDTLLWRVADAGAELVGGRFGLLEPGPAAQAHRLDTADVVVVPGVCYDVRGRRLGRGGGSYDRALSELPERVTVIGVALDSDVVDVVPVDTHDQAVDVIVTPTRVIQIDDGGQ